MMLRLIYTDANQSVLRLLYTDANRSVFASFSVLGKLLSAECCENHLAQTAPPQVRNVETESVPCKRKHCQALSNWSKLCNLFHQNAGKVKMYPLFADQKPGCSRVGIFLSEQTSQNHGAMLDLVYLPKKHSNIHRSCHIWVLIKTSCPNSQGWTSNWWSLSFLIFWCYISVFYQPSKNRLGWVNVLLT